MSIPAGSYIIRSLNNDYVLHRSTTGHIETCERDEEAMQEVMYQITHIASGEMLSGDPVVKTADDSGTLTAMWQFRRKDVGKDGGEYYNIVNGSGHGINVSGGVSVRKQESANPCQIFELIIPVTAIPCGWHQIQNVATGYILSHTYCTSPPQLISQALPPQFPSNYGESWGTQWAFIHANELVGKLEYRKRKYFVKNRLTSGHLQIKRTGTVACIKNRSAAGLCELDLDHDQNWQIKMNHPRTRRLLEQHIQTTAAGGSVAVAKSKQADPRRSWNFVPMRNVDAAVTQ
ncbi:hypothetical protein FN846DRAFT_904873 [Sphaerosporella brunnea]|uniref:Uncharacterized protein n=1 Tax=Sphaerosporella brunnea TaxID=1250544 RepID=A0A5J5F4B4_9PEZI|nr:hypothetical protein FN846DRAFT_904873 [Sphaerosporella brunnea]